MSDNALLGKEAHRAEVIKMSDSNTDGTLTLATFLSQLSYHDLPPVVVDQARKSILNVLGCGLGYAHHEPAAKAFAVIDSRLSEPEATILGRKKRTSLEYAALVNGIALTTADFDDTHLKTVIHPSGTPIAALLSWAEINHMSGEEFLLAFICGVEAQCAVGNAISPAHYRDGWHITGTTGTFGAAAAIAKAQKLSPKRFAAALGHAASMASGIRAMFGVDTKTLHMGRGAQNGILAAQLAAQDFNTCPRAIESWARLVSTTVNERAISNLAEGGSFEIIQNTFKPYPCGIVIHPLIDASIEAHKTFEIQDIWSIEALERIDAKVNPQCVRLCSVQRPKTGLQTIFSLYHGIASGLLFGRAGPRQFSDEGCMHTSLMQIRDKIHVTTDDSLRDDEAYLSIKLRDRQEHSIHIEHATGSLARPMTTEQLEAKFMELSNYVLGRDKATKVMRLCWKLEQVPDMATFVALLGAE